VWLGVSKADSQCQVRTLTAVQGDLRSRSASWLPHSCSSKFDLADIGRELTPLNSLSALHLAPAMSKLAPAAMAMLDSSSGQLLQRQDP
jgi:hypothetical protein